MANRYYRLTPAACDLADRIRAAVKPDPAKVAEYRARVVARKTYRRELLGCKHFL